MVHWSDGLVIDHGGALVDDSHRCGKLNQIGYVFTLGFVVLRKFVVTEIEKPEYTIAFLIQRYHLIQLESDYSFTVISIDVYALKSDRYIDMRTPQPSTIDKIGEVMVTIPVFALKKTCSPPSRLR